MIATDERQLREAEQRDRLAADLERHVERLRGRGDGERGDRGDTARDRAVFHSCFAGAAVESPAGSSER